jgi:hypothetical protein
MPRPTFRFRAVGSATVLALAGCAIAPPSGPNVVAMPGAGKTYAQFTSEDMSCRQTAALQAGPPPSAQQSTNAVIGSAAIGTALGAAAGAAIGSAGGSVGGGAAAGGALGLLAGSAVGASNAQGGAYDLQRRYDITYSQCMSASGNTIQTPPPPSVYAEPPVVVYPGYGPAYGYYPSYRRYYYRGWGW